MKKLILLSILCPFILASCPCAEHQAEQEMVQQQTIRVPYKYGGYNDRNMTVFTIVIDGEEYYMSYYDRSRTIWPKTKKPLEKPLK